MFRVCHTTPTQKLFCLHAFRQAGPPQWVDGLGLGTHLFIKVPRPGDSEVTFSVFESSCHLLLPVYHSKLEAISLSALPKGTISELGGLSPH